MLKAGVLVFRFLLHVSCGLRDPRGSNSHYYTDLMTQDVDGDLELSMQPDATPSSGGKGASKRGSNYSQEEDIQLCKSWISISNDAIVGTDQSGKTYWERITAHFHNFRGFHSDRTANSLEHRCGVIIKECMRFQAYYEEVERRHPSGVPYQEHVVTRTFVLSFSSLLLVHITNHPLIFVADLGSTSKICQSFAGKKLLILPLLARGETYKKVRKS